MAETKSREKTAVVFFVSHPRRKKQALQHSDDSDRNAASPVFYLLGDDGSTQETNKSINDGQRIRQTEISIQKEKR